MAGRHSADAAVAGPPGDPVRPMTGRPAADETMAPAPDAFVHPGRAGGWAGQVMAVENAAVERWAARLLHAVPGRVLEVGCGPGVGLEALGARAVGLDPARSMARQASRRSRAVIQGDAAALPFPDGRFGAVLAVHCLALLPLPALPEMRRVLRPGAPVLAIHRTAEHAGPAAAELLGRLRAGRFEAVWCQHRGGRLVAGGRAPTTL